MRDRLSEEYALRIQKAFHAALDCQGDAREACLDSHCAGAPAVRREVESLLEAYEEADQVLTDIDNMHGGYARAESNEGRLTGQQISHYQLYERLGGGGMGVVYRARDLKLDRLVALKFLPRHLCAVERIKQRFVREAKAVSVLEHPNICPVYDIDQTDGGRLFMAMGFYDSETLRQRLTRGTVPTEEVVELVRQIAAGLYAAHEALIVHRDVKPANVLLTRRFSLRSGELVEANAKLIDFGISFVLGPELADSEEALGTPAYMSPEQALRAPVDHRTDLWSLGVLFYEALAGQRPFQGDSTRQTIDSVITEEPSPLANFRSDVSSKLEQVVDRLLRKDPDERYQEASELLDDLK